MRELTGWIVVAGVLALTASGCTGGDDESALASQSDLAAVGLERAPAPALPDPNEDTVATLCGGLVVVQGTPGGLFDARTGQRHDFDFRAPGDAGTFDPEEFRMVHPPACVRDENRWLVTVEFVRRDLGLDTVVAGFGSDGENLWSHPMPGPVQPTAVGATVQTGDRLLDPATGHVLRRVRPRGGSGVLAVGGDYVVGVDRSRLLEVTDDPVDVGRLTDIEGELVEGAAPVFEPFLIESGAELVLGRTARWALNRTTAHDPRTGERRWTVPIGRAGAAPVLDRSSDTLIWQSYARAYDGEGLIVNAVDLRTGTVRWHRRVVGDEVASVSVGGGVGLYADGEAPQLFDARSGAPLELAEGLWPVDVSDAGLLVLDEDDVPRLVDPRDVTQP